MKKLMIAAAIVCAAAFAQAASVTWSTGGTMLSGNTEDWDAVGNTFAPDGWAVYLFDNATVDRATMLAALETKDSSVFSPYFADKAGLAYLDAAAGDYGGAFNIGNVAMTKDGSGNVNGYAIILDATTLEGAKNVFVTDLMSAAVGGSDKADINVTNYDGESDWNGLLNATEGWQSVEDVPEPTSGLLLLLGVAGLALKRKRA